MSNPWDIPPRRNHGDFNARDLFAAIGEALTEWEQVEAACARLFAVLVSVSRKSTYHAPAIRAYGTVISYPGRCEMLKAAAEAYFLRRKSKRDAWENKLNSLVNESVNFSARRNEIAQQSHHDSRTTARQTVAANWSLSRSFVLQPQKIHFGRKDRIRVHLS